MKYQEDSVEGSFRWISDFHTQTLSQLAESSGLTGSQLLVAANDETLRRTGLPVSLLPGPTYFVAPGGERYYTPTQLGRPYGMSPQKLNKLLEARGLQVKRFGEWSMTTLGSAHGVMLDTSKRHHSGTLVQQLKWRVTVLDLLELAG